MTAFPGHADRGDQSLAGARSLTPRDGDPVTATYLDKILDHHRAAAATIVARSISSSSAVGDVDRCRGFRSALARREQLGVIAEIKRRSPSKGDLNADLDATELARTYERGGASCLSVLTDVDHFGGSVDDLQTARAACALPVLRKDFTVSELDVVDTRLMGADCVLLIAAALEKSQLVAFHQIATEIGLDVLVEIHDEAELELALGRRSHADRCESTRSGDVRGRPRACGSSGRRDSRSRSAGRRVGRAGRRRRPFARGCRLPGGTGRRDAR